MLLRVLRAPVSWPSYPTAMGPDDGILSLLGALRLWSFPMHNIPERLGPDVSLALQHEPTRIPSDLIAGQEATTLYGWPVAREEGKHSLMVADTLVLGYHDEPQSFKYGFHRVRRRGKEEYAV